MNTVRTAMGITLVAMALVAFPLVPASLAQDANDAAHHPGQAAAPAGESAKMPMMAQMETMAKIKSDLAEAKGAAESQGDKTAVAKIDEALKLLDQNHQAMHQHMTQMMATMKQRMQNMQAMAQDMQKMQEEMGKSEQTKPMQANMEEMRQKMQKMQEQMQSEAKEGEMQCPMCKKMMQPSKPSMEEKMQGGQPGGMGGMKTK
jgi:exonuclease VII large subunit